VEILKNYYTVHKFGGSSVADASRFLEVKKILSGQKEVIVVSATKGTTSKLQAMLDAASNYQPWQENLDNLHQFHQTIIQNLLPQRLHQSLFLVLERDFKIIHNILSSINEIRNYSIQVQDFILGYGEQWSAQILTALLSLNGNALYLDATQVLIATKKDSTVYIDWEQSQQALINYCRDKNFDQLVITGFIASTPEGKRTTLGRNGSDFSGAIFARLFHATELIIWTDVDGIYTAHPAKVPSAFCINHLSYKEALELAYFGASVLHPMTIAPVQELNIPMYIKNSYNPTALGTHISQNSTKSKHLIKGLSYVDDITLINIEGAGMAGVSGYAAKIFEVLREHNISIILVSQASSEHSICLAINSNLAELASQVLQSKLKVALESGLINKINIDCDCAILAAVGDDMIGNTGVAGKFFDTLAKANINIRAIAQGSSERNISVVINSSDINKALQASHAGFYLSDKVISVGLIGPGGIGSTFLNQIAEIRENIKQRYHVDICIRGIMNSRKMLLTNDALADNWLDNFTNSNTLPDMELFTQHLLSDDIPHAVIVDCTASYALSKQYVELFKQGFNIITPNKHANAGDLNYYRELKNTAQEHGCHYLYEATVCAGLPIINTLQDLIKTGDEIVSIEGIVSGTLSYIFNELANDRSFAEVVIEARELGYTEPDPREDLSGQDVARKLVCLAREIGHNVSLNDIKVTSLVPEELQNSSIEEFLTKLPDYQHAIMHMAQTAKDKQEKLVYAGKINADGSINVAIKSVALNHPLARLNGTDNVIIFQTKRYDGKRPMVIQGPGAGAEVTAAGVVADLLRLTSYLY
jgi:aspartokinase/homoserine dehydrogenase 1